MSIQFNSIQFNFQFNNMNLELLDPFQRQIPDRVDATLHLPTVLHFRSKKSSENKNKKEKTEQQHHDHDDNYHWKAANHVAFNRRGAYIAVGYGSGTVGVYDVLSRTLSGLYRSGSGSGSGTTTTTTTDDGEDDDNNILNNEQPSSSSPTAAAAATVVPADHGVTSVSWSRRSRTVLAGAAGDAEVRLIDTTHPLGPEECCLGIATNVDNSSSKELTTENKEVDDINRSQSPSTTSDTPERSNKASQESSFVKTTKGGGADDHHHHKKPRYLPLKTLETTTTTSAQVVKNEEESNNHQKRERQSMMVAGNATKMRYPSIRFQLPLPVGASLQIHPKDTCAGLATLNDGSLVAFWVPVAAWEDHQDDEGEDDDDVAPPPPPPSVRLTTIILNNNRSDDDDDDDDDSHFITCAAFDPQGDRIYAATKEGKLMGFEVATIFDHFAADSSRMPQLKPSFTISIPGGATAWHIIVSRNGRYLVVNSADGAIRLYSTNECWTTPEEVEKPTFVFQDVVSKVKFASCDISGDAEYLVGGANGVDNRYELYIWNTSTGALMDKLTGATVELYSVAWHPTRSFLAVAASDGLVDIWGPRINWTAFAPDFQALPQNVEYVECEDEFDIQENDKETELSRAAAEEDDNEDEHVDVLKIDPVPVFASDSESEEDVFFFETAVKRLAGATTS